LVLIAADLDDVDAGPLLEGGDLRSPVLGVGAGVDPEPGA
jgi:hypothetical protein